MSTELTVYVTATAGNGCWSTTGSLFSNAYLYVGDWVGGGNSHSNLFFRFPGITIPQGSTILSATLTLTGASGAANTVNCKVYANNSDDAVAPTDLTTATALVKTTAFVAWDSLPTWVADTEYSPADISPVIQEVVNRALWTPNNALMLMVQDNASSNNAWREPKSFANTKPAKLVIVYELGGVDRTITGRTTIPLLQTYGTLVNPNPDRSLSGSVSMPSLSVQGKMEVSLPDIAMGLNAFLPAITSAAYGGGYADITLPAITSLSSGITGYVGKLSRSIPRIGVSAYGYQEGRLTLNRDLSAITVSATGSLSSLWSLSKAIPPVRLTAHSVSGDVGNLGQSIGAISLRATSHWTGNNYLRSPLWA